jgi:hypothetical protein
MGKKTRKLNHLEGEENRKRERGAGEPTNIREQVFKGGVSADILRCAFPAAFQGTF